MWPPRSHAASSACWSDQPVQFFIIAMGAIRPTTWTMLVVASVAAIGTATLMPLVIPRLYPRGGELPAS